MKSYQEIKNQITTELNEQDLVESIKYYNKKYRDGESEIEDYEYDFIGQNMEDVVVVVGVVGSNGLLPLHGLRFFSVIWMKKWELIL